MLIALAVCMAGWIQGCSTTDKKALEVALLCFAFDFIE